MFFMLVITLCTSIASAQQQPPAKLNMLEWFKTNPTYDGLPAENLKIDDVAKTTGYLDVCLVTMDPSTGVLTTPYLNIEKPMVRVWVIRGGVPVKITARLEEGPDWDGAWKKACISTQKGFALKDGTFQYMMPMEVVIKQSVIAVNGKPVLDYSMKILAN